MSVRIINYCKKNYKPNPEKIIREILERIPRKFLEGLNDVKLQDFGKEKYPMMRYVLGTDGKKFSRIEIYMDSPDFSGLPFFSIFGINIHFITSINEHIEKYLKPRSKDEEILSHPTSRANYSWMYFGVWGPVLVIIKMLNFLTSRARIIRNARSYLMKRLLKDLENQK